MILCFLLQLLMFSLFFSPLSFCSENGHLGDNRDKEDNQNKRSPPDQRVNGHLRIPNSTSLNSEFSLVLFLFLVSLPFLLFSALAVSNLSYCSNATERKGDSIPQLPAHVGHNLAVTSPGTRTPLIFTVSVFLILLQTSLFFPLLSAGPFA